MGKTRRLNRLVKPKSANKLVAPPEEPVQIELDVQEEKYDSCNALVLPPVAQRPKQEQKDANAISKKKKPLSKKQKKRLAKIIEKKQNKVNRSELLEKLQTVQASQEELSLLTSTSSMQTHGLKRSSHTMESENTCTKISNIKGGKKNLLEPKQKRAKSDPNVVGYDLSDHDDDDNDSYDIPIADDNNGNNIPHADDNNGGATAFGDADNESNIDDITETSIPEVLAKEMKTEKTQVTKTVENAGTANEAATPLAPKEDAPREPAVFIPVHRTSEIQSVREALPIYSEEQAIMEAIRDNSVVVIHGTTGSGKTTQVPQFLYEAGYTQNKKLIGITEPRRIAAVQMALRVGEEMNLPDLVSYHIRYEKTVADDKTEIKFMTDGVLLKEIRHDFLLTRYSVIIVDEAHERSVFSDVLIGLLSRILPLREKKGSPLKLVIMSATLRIEDFTENRKLFKQEPFLITIDARQYDVIRHFNTETPVDYIHAAYEKVVKIHQELSAGAVLVFVTGEKEVTRLCKMLRKSFSQKAQDNTKKKRQQKKVPLSPVFPVTNKKQNANLSIQSFSELPDKINLDDYSIEPFDNEGVQHENSDVELEAGSDDEEEIDEKLEKFEGCDTPLHVLPLYSVLPTAEQAKIFRPPPPGSRLCIVATNVAETSVTIPGLKYVVDSGKVKTRVYDKIASDVSNFVITWTSKASAEQRAGRAGRTEGGHCYRLYSSAVFEHDFPEYTPPDIERIPVDDILLQMKALGIDRVVNFPFPTCPDVEALKAAEKRLVKLGALQDLKKGQRYQDITKWEYSATVTPLGKAMSRFPLSPRFAKMLLLSYKHNVIPYIIAIVSAMTVPELFANRKNDDENDDGGSEVQKFDNVRKIGAGQGNCLKFGDVTVLLKAVVKYEESLNVSQFCSRHAIRMKAMLEIHKMRLQLIREMNRSFHDLDLSTDLRLEVPSQEIIEKLRKILASSLTDHVAKKMSAEELQSCKISTPGAYKCLEIDDPVYIHPSSVLSKRLPDFLVYQDVFQTSRYFMKTVAEIEPEWLTAFSSNQCVFSSPLENPPPYYNAEDDQIMCSVTSTFSYRQWQLPCVVMPMTQGIVKYTWFCFLFLNGQICPKLNVFKEFLISKADVMLKQWARLLPRTRSILQAVVSKEIDSREKLHEVWKGSPNYLLSEYCEWFLESKHMQISLNWPPVKK